MPVRRLRPCVRDDCAAGPSKVTCHAEEHRGTRPCLAQSCVHTRMRAYSQLAKAMAGAGARSNANAASAHGLAHLSLASPWGPAYLYPQALVPHYPAYPAWARPMGQAHGPGPWVRPMATYLRRTKLVFLSYTKQVAG
eukprot:4458498-Pleurochrysis_carterae.AAC.2